MISYYSIFLALLISSKGLLLINGSPSGIPILLTTIISIGYLVFSILKSNKEKVIGNIIITFALVAGSAAFPPVFILLIIWIVYNIRLTLKTIKGLLPLTLFSFLIWCLIYLEPIVFVILNALGVIKGGNTYILISTIIISSCIYLMITYRYSQKLSMLPSSEGYLQLAVTLSSIPLIILMIASMVQSLANLFSSSSRTVMSQIKTPQNVSSYMRGDSLVSGYTREVTKTVTQTVTSQTAGTGVVGVGVAATVSKSTELSDSKEEKSSNKKNETE